MAYTTINKSTAYFNTVLWSGNSTTDTAITGVGFQPDFLWLKQRTSTQSHQVLDAIRGANNILNSNTNAAAAADSEIVNSFDSDGFTLGFQDQSNDTGNTYVGWNWKANGTGSANSDGSISSTVSANTTAGFSIVTYTGTGANATVGHGLGSAPGLILFKQRSATQKWIVHHQSLGATKSVHLDTGEEEQNNTFMNNTAPTSSVFSLGTVVNNNTSSATYVAYCFAEKAGFSKFGSYIGNGNADGPFVYCGFKPTWIMFKEQAVARDWMMYDNKRLGYNPASKQIKANENEAEATDTDAYIDLCSNGFKIRGTKSWINTGSQPYLFMAFGQTLVGSNNTPATAK